MNLEWLSTAAVIAAVAALIVALAFVWWWVPKKQADRLRLKVRDPKARADIEDNFRKTLSQLFGGVAVLSGAAFAYYQSQLTAEQARLSLKASSDLLISQQISRGFEQLGSDNIIVRLGGIYALEGAMNTSAAYYKPIIEALSAFVRRQASNVTVPTPGLGDDRVSGRPSPDVQAALTVLGRRTIPADWTLLTYALNAIDLSGTNLVGSNLIAADLKYVNFSNSDLTDADFSGSDLTFANLSGAILTRTKLNGVDLTRADLASVDLRSAVIAVIPPVWVRCNSDTKFHPHYTWKCL